jgi:hypothetical protein
MGVDIGHLRPSCVVRPAKQARIIFETSLRPFLPVLLEPVCQRAQKRFSGADTGGCFCFADDVAAVVVQVWVRRNLSRTIMRSFSRSQLARDIYSLCTSLSNVVQSVASGDTCRR